MPRRNLPLVTGEIYHTLNRGTGSIPIFRTDKDYQKFLAILLYYQNAQVPFRFSRFVHLEREERVKLKKDLAKKKIFLVEIIAYCLMENHFHLLLKQEKDNGIMNLLRLVQNSYSHYFNKKSKRKGLLFEGSFKAIRVETEPQLLHLSRYIHLNPYSAYAVKNLSSLFKYPYSSLGEYINKRQKEVCQKNTILKLLSSRKKYKQFVSNQADYQRSLQTIKHQFLEK